MIIMLGTMLENVKKETPLVHNITNYVTVNDCANILIACGGAPIMSDEIKDVREITAVCTALNINIGTLSERTIPAMLEAGKISNNLGHPVVLDPVGAGASTFRTNTARQLIEEIRFSVVRGNISEIKALATNSESTKGVDANDSDSINENNIEGVVALAKGFAEKTGAVIAITGATDIVADADKAYIITNGHPMMSKISGTGCMLSSMTAAYIGANSNDILKACAAAVCAMGLCGERAFAKLAADEGNLTYRNRLFDEVFHLTHEELEKGARYEIR